MDLKRSKFAHVSILSNFVAGVKKFMIDKAGFTLCKIITKKLK